MEPEPERQVAKNEKTSDTVGKLASKAMREPGKMSKKEIASLGASALTQLPDKKVKPTAPKEKKGKK